MSRLRENLFRFYSKLLREHESSEALSYFFTFFTFVQSFIFQFIPFYVLADESNRSVAQIVSIAIRYSNSFKLPDDVTIFPYYIVIGFFSVTHLIFFILEYNEITIRGIYLPIRNIIFIFHYQFLAYPLQFHIGLKIRDFRMLKLDLQHMVTFVFDSTGIILLYILSYFLDMLLVNTPLCGSGYIPSRYFPDHFVFKSFIFDSILMIILLGGFDVWAVYFFSFVMMISSGLHFLSLWNKPFYSKTLTNIGLTIRMSSILIQLYIIIFTTFGLKQTYYVMLIGFLILSFVFCIVYVLRKSRSQTITYSMIANKFKSLQSYDPQEIIQYSDNDDFLSNFLVTYLLRLKKNPEDLSLILLLKIYKSRQNVETVLKILEFVPLTDAFPISHLISRVNKKKIQEVEINNSKEFWLNMAEKRVNEAFNLLFEEINKASVRNKLNDSLSGDNIECLIYRKEESFKSTGFVIASILLILLASFSMIPTFRITQLQNKLLDLPSSLKLTTDVVQKWYKIVYLISHSINCSEFTNLTCEDINHILNIKYEPTKVVCETMMSYYPFMMLIARTIAIDLDHLSRKLTNMKNKQFRGILEYIWNDPSIKFMKNGSTPDTYLSIRTILTFYITLIISVDIKEQNDTICENNIIDLFRFDALDFIGATRDIYKYFLSSSNLYSNYLLGITSSLQNNLYLIVIAPWIILVLGIPSFYYWIYSKYTLFYNILIDNFQISEYPFEKEVAMNKTKETFKYGHQMVNITLKLTLIMISYLVLAYTINDLTKIYLSNMINEYDAVIQLENVSIAIVSSLHTFYSSYLFPSNQSLDSIRSELKNLNEIITKLHMSLSVTKIGVFKNNNYPYYLKVHDIDRMVTSFHDIYAKFLITIQFEVFESLLIDEITRKDENHNFYIFVHLNHLYLTHFVEQTIQLSETILSYSNKSQQKINLSVEFNLFFYSVFIIFGVLSFYFLNVRFKLVFLLMNQYILELDKLFIAKEDCLMKYLLDGSEFLNKNEIIEMKALYSAADIPLIRIAKNNAIMYITMPVLYLFGYKEDQVIGQKISFLLPERYNPMLYHNLHSNVNRTVSATGLTNYGNYFPIQLFTRMIEGKLVIEIKSIEKISELEELINLHVELFDEIWYYSYPVQIFAYKTQRNDDFILKKFSRYAFLIIMNDLNKEDFSLSYQSLIQYFSHAIVIYTTCTDCCLLFVDDNPLSTAIYCYNEYSSHMKGGCIIEGDNINVVLTSVPQVVEFGDYSESAMFTPLISIEPMIDIFPIVSKSLDIIPGFLCSTNGILKLIDFTKVTKHSNDLLYFANHEIESIPISPLTHNIDRY